MPRGTGNADGHALLPCGSVRSLAASALCQQHLQRAKTQLDESLKQYKAKDKIALTDGFKKAIADYKKFITDRPTNRYMPSAVQGIYGVARIFEQHKAYDVPDGKGGTTWRWTRDPAPVRLTVVNGVVTFEDGKSTGARPGTMLAPGAPAWMDLVTLTT